MYVKVEQSVLKEFGHMEKKVDGGPRTKCIVVKSKGSSRMKAEFLNYVVESVIE